MSFQRHEKESGDLGFFVGFASALLLQFGIFAGTYLALKFLGAI